MARKSTKPADTPVAAQEPAKHDDCHRTASDVISGNATWSIEQADSLAWLKALPADSVDLMMFSPPYSSARSYGELNFSLEGEDWVKWMFAICVEAYRVCKGLIAIVVDDKTEDRRYGMTPFLLAADLHRAGYHLRHPCCYFRFGIPGSGSHDYWRNDWEPILIIARPGTLPWSDNTATGSPPKYGVGGEMSNRTKGGTRVNQWGGNEGLSGQTRKNGKRQGKSRPSHVVAEPDEQALPGMEIPQSGVNPLTGREDGVHFHNRPDGYEKPANPKKRKVITRKREGQHSQESTEYDEPVLANPGNVVKATYDAEQVRKLLTEFATRQIDYSNVIRCLAGGGNMGSPLAHLNEAPYAESLVTPFVLSFCPPGGIVADCFSGSGTTLSVAVQHGRRAIGCDLRPCQVALGRKRLSGETPDMFAKGGAE